MGMLERFGRWMDHFFARKQTELQATKVVIGLGEALAAVKASVQELSERITFLEALSADKKTEEMTLKLRDELNGIKALMKFANGRPNQNPPQKLDGSEPWKR